MQTKNWKLDDPLPEIQELLEKDICSFSMRKLKAYHPETYRHSVRTAGLCSLLYDELGLHPSGKTLMLRSALLHDIGKLAIDRDLLDKRERLTPEEWDKMRSHCRSGLDVLGQSLLRQRVHEDMILHHHENLDGTGYYGLTDEEISAETKILRTADSFDAMVFGRIYRGPRTQDEAFEELYRWREIHYDAAAVDALYRLAQPRQGKEGVRHVAHTDEAGRL